MSGKGLRASAGDALPACAIASSQTGAAGFRGVPPGPVIPDAASGFWL